MSNLTENLGLFEYQTHDSLCDSYKPHAQIYNVVVHKYMIQTEKYGALLTHTDGQTKSAVPRHAASFSVTFQKP